MGTWNISWPRSSLSTAGCIDYDAGLAATIGPNTLSKRDGHSVGIEWNIGHITQMVDLKTGAVLFEGTRTTPSLKPLLDKTESPTAESSRLA